MRDEVASFLLAVQFLTRVPVGSANIYSPERMAASVRYYPLVGLLVGVLCAGVFYAANLIFPVSVSVLLSLAAGLFLTGAFHEDGLADTFDGVGGGLTREKALQVMKDSRLGTYGTLALFGALFLKVAALVGLGGVIIPIALMAGHGLSRVSSVLVISTSTYVRDEGTGKPVAGTVSTPSLLVVLATGIIIMAVWCLIMPVMALVWAIGGLLLGHILMRAFFEPKLGGYTGDTLGAVQQASEVGFYLGVLAWL